MLITVMTMLLRLFVSRRLKEASEHAQGADAGHQHPTAGADLTFRERLTSIEAWSDVAHNFRNDGTMLWKEITIGLFVAGFIGLLGHTSSTACIRPSNHVLRTVENVILGPVVAVLSFVCSVDNIPLAAVLWSGGISFAGVLVFIFADLIVLPIIAIYRKYYGTTFALRITALMFVTVVIAALIVDALFGGLGLIPRIRPNRGDIFGSVKVDYNLFTNLLGVAIFATLFALRLRRGATDPVGGMKVDRDKAVAMEFWRARPTTSAPSTACTPTIRTPRKRSPPRRARAKPRTSAEPRP